MCILAQCEIWLIDILTKLQKFMCMNLFDASQMINKLQIVKWQWVATKLDLVLHQ